MTELGQVLRDAAEHTRLVRVAVVEHTVEALGQWLSHTPGCSVGEGANECNCGLWAAVRACRGGSDA